MVLNFDAQERRLPGYGHRALRGLHDYNRVHWLRLHPMNAPGSRGAPALLLPEYREPSRRRDDSEYETSRLRCPNSSFHHGLRRPCASVQQSLSLSSDVDLRTAKHKASHPNLQKGTRELILG